MRDRGACFVHKGREAKSKVGGWTRSLDSEEEEEQDRGEVRRATVTTRSDCYDARRLLVVVLPLELELECRYCRDKGQ